MKRILAILGDQYHDEKSLKIALEEAIKIVPVKGEEINVEYVRTSQLVEKLNEMPDAVVLSKANKEDGVEGTRQPWMNEQVGQAVCRYVEKGGGWFVWHSGLSSYETHRYLSMVRGQFNFHPAKQQVVAYELASNCHLMQLEQSVISFVDEHYFVSCDEENTNVFLLASSIDGHSPAGWYHKFGEGRVLCLTPAHSVDGLVKIKKVLAKSLEFVLNI